MTETYRDPDKLLQSGINIINLGFREYSIWGLIPLFSGGHDSYCACYIASKHPRFKGSVFHIDTGIGSKKTREFVEKVCKEEGWNLRVYKSNNNDSYENVVRRFGFPGPSMHYLVYNYIKHRSIRKMTRVNGMMLKGSVWGLVSGARSQESVRRMGHTVALKQEYDNNKPNRRLWIAPCYDWSSEDQKTFMDSFGLSRNPIKMSPLGMSGECFCGAFARPNELDMIRQICPDVAQEIDRLSVIARENGKPSIWGVHPSKGEIAIVKTGPLCTSCDVRAKAAGVIVEGVK